MAYQNVEGKSELKGSWIERGSRLEILAKVFEDHAAEGRFDNDPVEVLLKASTCAEIASYLRAMQTLGEQASKSFEG